MCSVSLAFEEGPNQHKSIGPATLLEFMAIIKMLDERERGREREGDSLRPFSQPGL